MTVTVVDRATLTAEHQPSVLPTVMREVPGLFVTLFSLAVLPPPSPTSPSAGPAYFFRLPVAISSSGIY
jgi:hypothetical protein